MQQCFSQNLGQRTSLTETRNHGLAEAGHKTRPRRAGTPSNMTRERMAQKLRDTLIQNITRLLKNVSTDLRAHGVLSTREQNVAACVATSQRHGVTNKQRNEHGWAESPKQHVSRQSLQNMRFRGNHLGHVPRPTRKR